MKKKTKNKPKNEINATEYVENKTYRYTVNGNNYTGTYTGNWKNGKPEGNGKLYDEYGKLEYEGFFENGECTRGTFYGIPFKYQGPFKDYRPEGHGVQMDGEEPRYIGYFKKGEYNGTGCRFINGKVIYNGEFLNGRYNGKGKSYYEDGEALEYEGEFLNGRYNGKGKLYREDGTLK